MKNATEDYKNAEKSGKLERAIPTSSDSARIRAIKTVNALYALEKAGYPLPDKVEGVEADDLLTAIENRGILVPSTAYGIIDEAEIRSFVESHKPPELPKKKHKRTPHEQELWRQHMYLKYGIKNGR